MIFKNFFVYPKYPENLTKLYRLACNLWAVWDYDAIALFYRIDTSLFRQANHSPLKFLHSLSKEKLAELAQDRGFLFELDRVWEKFQAYLKHTAAFKEQCPFKCDFEPNDIIAYFSMEYGFHESVPIYAGGLGIFSGDFLKAASDLDMPIIGVGLLYKHGYFTQKIDFNGLQQETFPEFDKHLLMASEVRDQSGNPVYVNVQILDSTVKVKLWKIDVGKTRVILLDTNIDDNPPNLRDITSELYASNRDKRIQQELVLGVGGVWALNALGLHPKVYHINEGHCAFTIVARLQTLMEFKKFSFSQAKAIVRASTALTVHTPVIAGNENFDAEVIKKYLQPYLKKMELPFEKLAQSAYLEGSSDRFWMPAMGMHFARYTNAVSQQHADTARKMWWGLFPERPLLEVPIGAITDGAHLSWISPAFAGIFNRYLGPDYILCGNREYLWNNIYNIPDEEIWEEHRKNKKDLINFIRRQSREQMVTGGYSHSKTSDADSPFNTDFLTIVFARRFAAYKRPTLILTDKERIAKILTHPHKPVQLIFAGKAHPADLQCKQMIKEILDFARRHNVEHRIIFLENYDMNIARHLLWGADVWLNNPLADMEACGTSGMKAGMNGVLHFSTLEGWWVEGYNGKNGWAITAGRPFKNTQLEDAADANQLYELLENQITELYYDRSEADVPRGWVKMMKESLFTTCCNFSMNRVLCNYMQRAYMPAKEASNALAANNYQALTQAMKEEEAILKCWDKLKITALSTSLEKVDHVTEDESITIECTIDFDAAPAELFKVELFYIYAEQQRYKIFPMELSKKHGSLGHFQYTLKVKGFGSQSVNIRLIPANPILQDIHPELIKWKD
jgi:starch phosphorylase